MLALLILAPIAIPALMLIASAVAQRRVSKKTAAEEWTHLRLAEVRQGTFELWRCLTPTTGDWTVEDEQRRVVGSFRYPPAHRRHRGSGKSKWTIAADERQLTATVGEKYPAQTVVLYDGSEAIDEAQPVTGSSYRYRGYEFAFREHDGDVRRGSELMGRLLGPRLAGHGKYLFAVRRDVDLLTRALIFSMFLRH